jgi:Holliday junction resolvase RusA-like endonuclease
MAQHLKRNILLFSDKVEVKPMSVNQAWQGRKFKSPLYKEYEKEVLLKLHPHTFTVTGPIELNLFVGVSNAASDADNVVKPFVDILQKKYGFNDKFIYRLVVEKVIVKKGAEFIEFFIKNYEPNHYVLANSEN